MRSISPVVESPATFGIRWMRPPYFLTVGASIQSSPYSEPLTCTLGLTTSKNGMGTVSSKMWT